MIGNRRQSFGVRLRRWLMLAAGSGLAVAGCASVPDGVPEAFEMPRMLPSEPGSKAEAKAFRERVHADPFPEAASG
jgi:hypothetical protein